MVSPQIEMRLRARYHAIEQVLGLLEDIEESPESEKDQRIFQESLREMEQEALGLAQAITDEAAYYSEQAALFHEIGTWPLGT